MPGREGLRGGGGRGGVGQAGVPRLAFWQLGGERYAIFTCKWHWDCSTAPLGSRGRRRDGQLARRVVLASGHEDREDWACG